MSGQTLELESTTLDTNATILLHELEAPGVASLGLRDAAQEIGRDVIVALGLAASKYPFIGRTSQGEKPSRLQTAETLLSELEAIVPFEASQAVGALAVKRVRLWHRPAGKQKSVLAAADPHDGFSRFQELHEKRPGDDRDHFWQRLLGGLRIVRAGKKDMSFIY